MNKDTAIDKVLCYMHDCIIKRGYKINQVHFDFNFENDSKSEDLQTIRKLTKLNDNEIKSLLRECISYEYIKRTSISEEFLYLQLTDRGMARAISTSKSTPKKNAFHALLAHPLFNTIVSSGISFILGYYLGGNQ